jgi:hypothetical protein
MDVSEQLSHIVDQKEVKHFIQKDNVDISRSDWEDYDHGNFQYIYQGEERGLFIRVDYDIRDQEGTPGEYWREPYDHRVTDCYWIEFDGEERVVSLDKATEEFILNNVDLTP